MADEDLGPDRKVEPGRNGHAPDVGHNAAAGEQNADEQKQDGGAFEPWKPQKHPQIDHNQFVIGAQAPIGNTIQRIFGISRDYLIWLDDQGEFWLHYNDELPEYMRPALNEFRQLRSIAPILADDTKHAPAAATSAGLWSGVRTWFKDARTRAAEAQPAAHPGTRLDQERLSALNLLAAGLIHAFNCKANDDVLAGLKAARSFILGRVEERARANFLFITMAASVTVFIALYLLHYPYRAYLPTPTLRQVVFGGMAGIIGASISLIQRSATMQIDPLVSHWHKAFQAILRSLLGMLFGMIVVVAMLGDLAFAIAKDNHFALFTLALVGGFSERLVPDMLGRWSQEHSANTGKAQTQS